jgi:L-glutamine-phosphate cytidylyltransferase
VTRSPGGPISTLEGCASDPGIGRATQRRSASRGIILAAGRGSRLGHETDDRPKCLVSLGGRTLLEWQLAALAAAGLDRIVVVGGYRSELLSGDYEVVRNERWASTSVMGTLAKAGEWLAREDSIVSYSDIVYHPDHVRRLLLSEGDIAITYDSAWKALWTERFERPLSDAETFSQQNGRLIDIGAPAQSLADIGGQFMGLLRVTPRGWSQISECWAALSAAEQDRLDMTSMLSRLLRAGIPVRAVAVEGRWCEVDSDKDLALYRRRIAAARGEPWSHDWRAQWPARVTRHRSGRVIWLTGLSGSGKTTLAKAIQVFLRGHAVDCVIVDGDMVRAACGSDCGYDDEGRRRNAKRVSGIAKMIADQGVVTVVATISLYHEVHAWNRLHQPNYFEVLVDVDATTRRRRDYKSVYRPEAGEVAPRVVGVDIAPEFPRAPHLHVDNSQDRTDLSQLVETIVSAAGLWMREPA